MKFFRFNAGLAAALVAIAIAFAPGPVGQVGIARLAFQALVAFEVALIFYWLTIGRAFTPFRVAILAFVVSLGVVALVLQAFSLSAGDTATMRILTVVSFLSSAAFLGGACTAMILGH